VRRLPRFDSFQPLARPSLEDIERFLDVLPPAPTHAYGDNLIPTRLRHQLRVSHGWISSRAEFRVEWREIFETRKSIFLIRKLRKENVSIFGERSVIGSFHLGHGLEQRIIGVFEKLSKIYPTYTRSSLSSQVFNDLLSTVKAPSEMLVILLLPRNELVDGKRIHPIRGKRTCLKGISAIARVRGWEMTTGGSQSPVGRMGRG
jgi:hypothetical protein